MSLKRKKKLLLMLLIFCCSFVASGYVILINALNIGGKIKIEAPTWAVEFSNVKTENIIGDAVNYRNPIYDKYYVDFYAVFKNIGDSITYDIEIENKGTLDAEVSYIGISYDKDALVRCEYSNIEKGTVLKSREKMNIKVKLIYDSDIAPKVEKEELVRMLINWKQAK